MAQGICWKDCWDSTKAIFYTHGRTYEIDAKNPLAKYFDFGKSDGVKQSRGNPNWTKKEAQSECVPEGNQQPAA